MLYVKNPLITIKLADKGGAVVVMDTEKYCNEIYRQLLDITTYKHLDCYPVWSIKEKLGVILNRAGERGFIDPKLKDYLTIDHPAILILYILPKIHKSLTEPPGRPVVSGLNSILSNASKFVDQVLKPSVLKMKSYIRDTGDFLSKIRNVTLPLNSILMTLDVTSLSMEHHRGIRWSITEE